jgi:hypothetical protein
MEIIKHTQGKDAGKISVLRTINTMAPGETWAVAEGQVQLAYVHSACSRFSRMSTDRTFSVKSPSEYGGLIEITCKSK